MVKKHNFLTIVLVLHLAMCGSVRAFQTLNKNERPGRHESDFRMCAEEGLSSTLLKALSKGRKENHLVQLSRWPRNKERSDRWPPPVQVRAELTAGTVQVRWETNYLILHYKSPTNIIGDEEDLLDGIRRITRPLLAERFVLANQERINFIETRKFVQGKPVQVMYQGPRKLSTGTSQSVFCVYMGNTRLKEKSSTILDGISVLANDEHLVVVMRRAFPGGDHVCDGLLAAQVRVSEKNKKMIAGKSVLARNVVFDQNDDLSGIPDELLNGCMWPIKNKTLIGAVDYGPVRELKSRNRPRN